MDHHSGRLRDAKFLFEPDDGGTHFGTVPVCDPFSFVIYRRRACLPQTVGIKQTDERIWLVSFMDYNLGYFDDDMQARTPCKPFRSKSFTYIFGMKRNPCVRNGPDMAGSPGWIRTSDHSINSRMLYR
jgi:hypothetical protein